MRSRPSTTHAVREKHFEPFILNISDIESNQSSQTTRESSDNFKKPKKDKLKSKFEYHSINSRIGSLYIPNSIQKSSRKAKTSRNSSKASQRGSKASPHKSASVSEAGRSYNMEDDLDSGPEMMEIFATLALLKTMDSSSMLECISTIPIFFRTLFMDGYLDSSILSSISVNLQGHELETFICNMTQEINFYNGIMSSSTLQEVENVIVGLIPVQKAIIWIKSENTGYLFSETLRQILPINKSIIGYSVLTKEDLITNDPGNHTGFYIDFDLTLLRDIVSLICLPIKGNDDSIVAVLQVHGFFNQISNIQEPFPQYFVEILKLVRSIVQDKFFNNFTLARLPSDIANVLENEDFTSVSSVMKSISNYVVKKIPCESCEIYYFDDRYSKMTNLVTGKTYTRETGGISFEAGTTKDLVNQAHGLLHPCYLSDIDGCYVNKSIISRSYFTSRDHIVLTFRAKWNSPIFLKSDIETMDIIAPFVFDILKLANHVSSEHILLTDRRRRLSCLHAFYKTLHMVSFEGLDIHTASRTACETLLGSKIYYICTFDGQNMNYLGTDVKFDFEKCVSGVAYNYRKFTICNEGDEIHQYELYTKLGTYCRKSAAFPFRFKGKIIGSIEVLDPNSDTLDLELQCMFCNLISVMFSRFILDNKSKMLR